MGRSAEGEGKGSWAPLAGAALIAFGIALLIWWLWPSGPPFGEVSGLVTLDGQPLPFVEVVFMPDPGAGSRGPASSAVTDKNGMYRVGTMKGRVGALVGTHRVVIMEAQPDPDEKPEGWDKQPPRVAAVYSQAAYTPFINIEVKEGKQNHDFTLASNPGLRRQ